MESFDSLSALAGTLPAMPGHASLPATEHHISMRTRLAVEKAMADNPGDEPAQIDAIAKIRRYFMGQGRVVGIVDAYIDGATDVQETVRQIAEPIEYAYTTANGGRLFVSEEKLARHQRPFHSPDKAVEMWGPEENIDEFQARVTDPIDAPSVEGELWDLYYTILHASKRIPWIDGGAQQKLVDLLASLKARPNPPRPAGMTVALNRYWIYEWGELWGDLVLLGPAGRETWNDSPGCGSGWEKPEVSAWLNVNAFVARLTVQGVRNFATYGNWALRDALEEEIEPSAGAHHPAPSKAYKAELLFQVAAVWIRLAGQYMFDRLIPDPEDGKEPDTLFWTHSQWDKWRGRFEEEAQKEQYSNEVTIVAKECAAIMATFSVTPTVD
ncbi:hypothetical protein Daus18300_002607 [Diaporthe australafricana]|uniref:Uncharacterized protein n=1 Tax=Diaporthe australafricana TaxID=127596 RepID=A0ABR3XLY6_9PEZI